MIEKITRRVSRPTTFLSSLLSCRGSFSGLSISSFTTFLLNTKNLSARTKLVKIRITKKMTSHSINTLTPDNYDY